MRAMAMATIWRLTAACVVLAFGVSVVAQQSPAGFGGTGCSNRTLLWRLRGADRRYFAGSELAAAHLGHDSLRRQREHDLCALPGHQWHTCHARLGPR